MAVSYQSVGAIQTGTGANRTPDVPTGVAAGSLIVAVLTVSSNVSPGTPTDFTDKLTTSGVTPTFRLHFKKALAADTGTYTIPTGTSASSSAAQALRFEDEDPAADPFGATDIQNGSGTTLANTSLGATDVPAGDILLWVAGLNAARTCTIPSGYTRITPNDSRGIHMAYKVSTGGTTGTVSASVNTTVTHNIGLLQIKSEVLVTINPSGIASTAVVGTPQLNSDITASGIASTAAVGTPTLGLELAPTGIAPTSTLGTPSLDQQVLAAGIASTAAFGSPTVFTTTPINPTGIASTAAVGTPQLDQQVSTPGIAPTTAVGTPTISIPINPTGGIGSTVAFGTPALAFNIDPTGIASTAAFGTARLDQQITITSLATTTQLGTPMVVAEVELPDRPHLKITAYAAKAAIRPYDAKAAIK
jgi:hypothetical protein